MQVVDRNSPGTAASIGDAGAQRGSATATDPSAPGRSCPIRYRYRPQDIAAAPLCEARILYVIGGLYGNLPALDTIEAMAAAEPGPVTLHFNGDFNWFDVSDVGFRELNERVLRHQATLGNVEAELLSEDGSAGCGCAYPMEVEDSVVERSNAIHSRLSTTAKHHPDLLSRLAELPMYSRYRIGDARIAIVHGDCESLAGWSFDVDALDNLAALDSALTTTDTDIIASSHTCLPVMRRTPRGVLANNGAAGMPNFRNDLCGLITRVAEHAGPHAARYGTTALGVRIEALAVHYDQSAWQHRFLNDWPAGSAAHTSYWQRITEGTTHLPTRAAP